ncbi:FAD linked oxidase [Penicillium soppii]|uniref:FAD linked oxidase n=1 Tax=Penicillium soppii TaxID=69789 RepID=UPI0025470310|nr:FAD linked oxidase [Penicillium soppii]KAJ5860127.1 FAD linked oxidase [Penicillium soppii]
MPITPRQVNEGVLKGVVYFGLTFDIKEDIDRVLPAHDKFVQSMQKLAADQNLYDPTTGGTEIASEVEAHKQRFGLEFYRSTDNYVL